MAATPEDAEKLSEFRSRVYSMYPECDNKLLIWLNARDMNVDKAEQMLKRHLIWRRNNEIDGLITWQSPKVFLPYIHTGWDYDGCPVFILPLGRWEYRAVVEAGDMAASLKYIYQCLETLVSLAYSRNMHQGVFICDFEGFGYKQLANRTVVQGMIEVMRVFEANYPESLKAAFVVNAPKLFHVLFTMIKPLLNSHTLSKLQIFGPDREKWQARVLKAVPKDQLPKHWGGTRDNGSDEYCSDLWSGGPLHPLFMRKLSMTTDDNGEEWFTVKIEAREEYVLNYDVKDVAKGHTLKWEFTTDNYDIGFSVHREDKNSNGEKEYLVPNKRVDSHLKTIDGFWRLEERGSYKVTFDNSYSRGRAKTVHCSILLMPPKI